MNSPLDEYFMEKEAVGGFGGFAQKAGRAADRAAPTLGELARNSAVQFGVAAALSATAPVAAKVYNAVTKRHSYNRMLEQNPDLRDMRNESPDSARQFNNMYNSLHSMNPDFARDPTVSGSYMRQMMAHPEGAGKVIVESLRGKPSSPFGEPFRAGAQAGIKSFGKGFGKSGD